MQLLHNCIIVKNIVPLLKTFKLVVTKLYRNYVVSLTSHL